MSKKTVTTHYCDICDCEIPDYDRTKNRFTLPVRFLTEQNEGYPSEPYFSHENTLDLCDECALKAITIDARGAMGYNKYRFRDSMVQ